MSVIVLALAAFAGLAADASAAELQPKTVAAFDRYVRAAEAAMDPKGPFLWMDGLSAEEQKRTLASLRKGELVIARRESRDKGREIDIPDGMVHHWVGTVLVPNTTLEAAVVLLQDYDRHASIYAPNVARSRLLARDGDTYRVFLRFFMEKVIAVVVNSEHQARFTRHGPDRVSSRIVSTRIAEVEDPDTPREREKPVGRDGGYLWRLNSYWRFDARPEGVYIQCESITLTRGIPFGFGWLIGPFVTSIPRETLTFTLETTRTTLAKKP